MRYDGWLPVTPWYVIEVVLMAALIGVILFFALRAISRSDEKFFHERTNECAKKEDDTDNRAFFGFMLILNAIVFGTGLSFFLGDLVGSGLFGLCIFGLYAIIVYGFLTGSKKDSEVEDEDPALQ